MYVKDGARLLSQGFRACMRDAYIHADGQVEEIGAPSILLRSQSTYVERVNVDIGVTCSDKEGCVLADLFGRVGRGRGNGQICVASVLYINQAE
jgi:hypothetical protein